MLINDGNGLHLDFSLRYGPRKWMISALNAEQCLRKDKKTAIDEERSPDAYPPAPLPQQYLIKHGHFPLDVVKDYVLSWDNTAAVYPHMLFTRADAERLRARVDPKPFQRTVPSLVAQSINYYDIDRLLETWYATGDERLGPKLVAVAAARMQEAVDVFMKQQTVTYGCAPHHVQLLGDAMTLADAALGSGCASPEMRARLLAQAAFVAYAVNRPEFWSPARGYSANPNMTTSVTGYLIAAACLTNTHPLAQRWAEIALQELRDNELHGWSDANGGWLEAPHYAMVSYDQILGGLLMAYNSGISDALYTDPKVKTVINWFSKLSSPPDALAAGHAASAAHRQYLHARTQRRVRRAGIFVPRERPGVLRTDAVDVPPA